MVRNLFFSFFIVTFFLVSALAQAPLYSDILIDTAKAQSFDERLGTDDGAAMALLFGANMRGNLELCDCNVPRGGLARRIGYIEAFKNKFKETPVLNVDVGQFWYNSETQTPYIVLQNEQVAQAYSFWGLDVINLGRYDLLFANRLLGRDGIKERTAKLSMLKNLVSANGVFADNVAPPAPYLIKEVRGARIKGAKKSLRIGFLGLAEPLRVGSGMMDATVKSMFETARRYLPQLRKSCDVLVILAHAEMAAAMQLANENPQADIVIAGNAEGLFKPRQVGKTIVLSAAPGNMQQGDLRLYLSADGKISYKYRSTDLDSLVPSDPTALAFTQEASAELFKLK
ncbi:MAG: hypothetical protein AB1757_20270 [Acidobacteriota bacterium]